MLVLSSVFSLNRSLNCSGATVHCYHKHWTKKLLLDDMLIIVAHNNGLYSWCLFCWSSNKTAQVEGVPSSKRVSWCAVVHFCNQYHRMTWVCDHQEWIFVPCPKPPWAKTICFYHITKTSAWGWSKRLVDDDSVADLLTRLWVSSW